MGRYWCQKDPQIKVNGAPVQIRFKAPIEILDAADSVEIVAILPPGSTAEADPGQEQKEVFGVEYTLNTVNTDDESRIGFSVKVTTDNIVDQITLMLETHDPQNVAGGNAFATGVTNELIAIDGRIE